LNSEALSNAQPHYRLLDANQIEKIHQAVLHVLATIGVRVLHPQALLLLREAGCQVSDDSIVLIPGKLVEECIRSAPSLITIYNRLGLPVMQLGGRNLHFGMGTDLLKTVDLDTGLMRPSVLKDVAQAARVADACEEIDFIASFALPQDVPTNTMYIECFKAEMENSVKPIFFTAAEEKDLAFIIRMAALVAGGEEALREKPFLINYSEPTSPLTHSYGALSKLLLCAEKGVPICYTPAAMMGATAPVTLVGALIQATAEALSGIVIHQLKARGAPIISGVGLPVLDMRTSCVSYSAPELRLSDSAFADMFHSYGLPIWSTSGSDSHCLDEQAAMEHTYGILMASLTGANLIHDVGYLGQGLLGNPACIVMCNEIISYTGRVMRGFSLDDASLALEAIREVGPGGNYLTHEHTLLNFRKVLWKPQFLNRQGPDEWQAAGGLSYRERVIRKTKDILASYQPQALDPTILEELGRVVTDARNKLETEMFTA
jgi:trimethylamine--corrinoid protein Co-methyltransferase